MKKYLIPLSIFALAFGLGWTASIWRFGLPHWGREGPPRRPDKMFEEINLSPEQRKAVDSIHVESQIEKHKLEKSLRDARTDFEKCLGESQDIRLLEEKYKVLQKWRNELEWAHFRSMMRVHEQLTLEQIQELGKRRPPEPPPPFERKGPPPHRGDGPPPPHEHGR